mgnify:CR=1 FL=1
MADDEARRWLAPLLIPVVVMGVPILDTAWAIVRRTRKGLSPTHPDRMHMHHRLLAAGHSHERAVLVMYTWTAVAAFSLAAMAFFPIGWVLLAAAVGVALAVAVTLNAMPGLFRRRAVRGGAQSQEAPRP